MQVAAFLIEIVLPRRHKDTKFIRHRFHRYLLPKAQVPWAQVNTVDVLEGLAIYDLRFAIYYWGLGRRGIAGSVVVFLINQKDYEHFNKAQKFWLGSWVCGSTVAHPQDLRYASRIYAALRDFCSYPPAHLVRKLGCFWGCGFC